MTSNPRAGRPIRSADDLLARLMVQDGMIVCASRCTALEIAAAAAAGDVYVDAKGSCYVLRPKAWLQRATEGKP